MHWYADDELKKHTPWLYFVLIEFLWIVFCTIVLGDFHWAGGVQACHHWLHSPELGHVLPGIHQKVSKAPRSKLDIRAILITKNRDMKTRDVSHCVSSLLRKHAMLAPTEKNCEVSGRTAHAQFTRLTIPRKVRTAVLYTKFQYGRSHAEVTWVKSWFFCCVRSHYKTPCEVRKIALQLAIFRAKFWVEFGTVARQLSP